MKILKAASIAAMAAAMMTVPGAVMSQNNAAKPVPIEVWALRDVVNAVQISPDGKHLLVHKTESKEGEYLLEIYETSNLTKPLRRLNADPMEIISARWVNDNYIFGTAWQVNRKKVQGGEEDVRDYKAFSYSLAKNKFAETGGNFDIINTLPKEPNHVLVATATANTDKTGVDPFAAFRPRSYYRFNLDTGARELVLRGNPKQPTAEFDLDGNPRFSAGYNEDTKEQILYFRQPGEGSWREFSERFDLDEHKNLYRVLGGFMGAVGFDEEDPSIGYVIDNRGEDKAALWAVDFKTGQFVEKLYSNPDADVIGVQTSSMPDSNRIVAAIYPGAKYERHWFDTSEKALYESLEKQIPNSHQVSIQSRTRDGKSMVVYNEGPKDPGSFWLVLSGKMLKLGSRNPLLRPDQLADVEFIKYKARDGRTIPAYVTKPKGEGPFPLVVLPHGGPHVNEVVAYDEWGQMLANNGYMVLQPQYRISVGWGQSHFDAGYGEHGLAMQDDKDDGAMYLVEKGWADPKRLSMFGWSYGGYAALVASQRENNIYQCAIAGAAVADPEKSYRERRDPYSPKALDDWAQRRGMIGVNPVKNVNKVNVPLMMVHGDVDRRVLYYHQQDFQAEMERQGKYNARVTVGENAEKDNKVEPGPATPTQEAAAKSEASIAAGFTPRNRFVTLEGADHFYVTLMYEHQEKLYTQLLDFLKNDCGPGGL
jgi:dipeptidyl aminopeptidase/acylaminoacyl peptidase